MLCTNFEPEETMLECLLHLIRSSRTLKVATAYVGEEALVLIRPALTRLVNNGCRAEFFIGMAVGDGLYPGTLRLCQSLHDELTRTGGGVFATQEPFHSKIYTGQIDGVETAWIGSSNLTIHGLLSWREANIRITGNGRPMQRVLREMDLIATMRIGLDQIQEVTLPVTRIIEPQREYPDGPAFQVVELPLYRRETGEVQERHGLNWWNGGGRRRDPNEACISLSVRDIKRNPAFFPNRAHQGTRFTVYTDDHEVMEMQIEGGGPIDGNSGLRFGKQIASTPRKATLGEWILRRKLNLPPWTVVEKRMLRGYGKDSIKFIKMSHENYLMMF